MTASSTMVATAKGVRKCPTGIRGLDDITNGGLPAARTTLVSGNAGCGKTLFGMEFLVRGATEFGEPGLFMAFEETGAELSTNLSSLGFDLDTLIAEHKLAIDHVVVERSDIREAGEYDLEALFIRLQYAIDTIGARRVVLDTVESLFSGIPHPAILRAELRRLVRWLKDKGVTSIVTAERGEIELTRYGMEEYVCDCIVLLDHRVTEQVSTRRLRIAKYRGSSHGTNEYPFLINANGLSVLPVTSLGLSSAASNERVSSGIPALDQMLGGQGYYRGSSVLMAGTAGCGKTSVGAHFADAACRRGERCLTFLFEESPTQLVRNMRSIGIDLQQWLDKGNLCFHAARPSLCGLEMHLVTMMEAVTAFKPDVVVIDPMSSFTAAGSQFEIKAMLIRLMDFLKMQGITVLMINLSSAGSPLEHTDAAISSVVDTWLLVRDNEVAGERSHGLYILKSRGMAHSHKVRRMSITSAGIQLAEDS